MTGSIIERIVRGVSKFISIPVKKGLPKLGRPLKKTVIFGLAQSPPKRQKFFFLNLDCSCFHEKKNFCLFGGLCASPKITVFFNGLPNFGRPFFYRN